ncbi:hypothetical protein JKP88DRAFT_338462 [Tribonema minus]|uniref:Fe2OG dioxygenase domain-containing protein n=1 Tax=Tribonema minus TaxID=303371 RepID=A0A835YHJ7_9STRA|nr:hypothetical protein JKP88DRAFT_338462 [Tribonema minus]
MSRAALPPNVHQKGVPPESCLFEVMDDVLTRAECSAFVTRMTPALRSVSQALAQYHPDGDQRKSRTEYQLAVMENRPFAEALWERLQACDGVLEAILAFAEREGRGMPVGLTPRLRMLRYAGDDRFDAHYDRVVPEEARGCESLITVLVYLNDGGGVDFSGGETLFINALEPLRSDAVAVVPRAGRVVLFEHALYHSGSPLQHQKDPSEEGRGEGGGGQGGMRGRKFVLRTDVLFRMQNRPQRLSPDLRALVLSFVASAKSLAKLATVSKGIRKEVMNPAHWAQTLCYSHAPSSHGEREFLRSVNRSTTLVQLLKQPRFRQVTHLSIPTQLKLGTTTFRSIARVLPQLTYLNTCNARNVKTPALLDLARSMPNLKTVILGEPTIGVDLSSGVCAICNHMKSLERLEILGWFSPEIITDRLLAAIATLPHLRHLKITQGQHSSPRATTERGVTALVSAANMAALETLTIHGVRGVTAAAVEAARVNCARLRHVDLRVLPWS